MKRIILAIALLLVATAAMAENTRSNDSTRYLSSTITQNWFVMATGSVNWWQGSDVIPAGNFTTLNGPSFGGEFSVGKWITHNLAFRLAYQLNPGKSFIDGKHDGLPGIQFLYVDKTKPITVVQDGITYQYYETAFKYHNFHADLLLSPVDIILGYYDDRFLTPIIAIGMGVGCVSEHAFVTQSLLNGESRNFELSFIGGLINNFRMNKNFDLSLVTMVSGQRWTIDSWTYEYGGATSEYGGTVDTHGIRPKIADINYSVQVGVTWNMSGSDEYGNRIYELPNNYSTEMKDMRKRIRHLEEELDECISKQPIDTIIHIDGNTSDTVQEIVSFPFSIFFHLDSYQLMSKRDLVNLQEIANVALEKGWKIRLRGSCDSATATPEYNNRLSENRCNKIKLELMEMGVPEEQFILVPVGGVKELDPTEYDRRVLIQLVKEIK